MEIKKIYCTLLVIILLLNSTVLLVNSLPNDKQNSIENMVLREYNGAYRYNTHGWIYLHIEGDPYERGYQHGYLLADEIVDNILRWSEIFPNKWSWKIQKQTATRLFWNKYPDEYKQEIKGIADGVADRGGRIDGSLVDYRDILTLNEMYEMMSRFRTYYLHPIRMNIKLLLDFLKSSGDYKQESIGKCSVFIATGNATRDGGIVAAHTTFAYKNEGTWFSYYIAERWNLILDIKPASGHRILMASSPGLIWSDHDFYQNDAGMILMETTLEPLGTWTRLGDPVVVRARKAIQYSDSLDEIIDCLITKNNGLMANDWIMGDTKTGEIASLELALHNHGIQRTRNGFIWSCNNPKDKKVRRELNSLFGFGIIHGLTKGKFKPNDRDIKFEELKNLYYGNIDANIAKKIMATEPLCSASSDCKITDSNLVNNFGFWVFMGNPNGVDFIADEHPFSKPHPSYTDLPASGWKQIYALSPPSNYQADTYINKEDEKSNIVWTYKTKEGFPGNSIYSSLEFQKNALYFTTWNGYVYSLNISTGKLNWMKKIGWSSTSNPLVTVNYIYVGSSEGLYKLDKETGEVIWVKDVGTISTRPYFYEDKVYCSSYDGNIYAVDSESSDIKWFYKTDDSIYSSPVVYNNVLYVGSNDKNLYAIDAENGELKWVYTTNGAICSSPVVSNDVVYFGSWDNNLYALDAESGKLKWKYTTGWGIDSSPTIYNDTIYVGSEDNNLYALDAESGDLKWIFVSDGGISSSPIVYGGSIFFGSSDGKIYVLDSNDGELVWSDAPDYYIDGVYNYKTKPIVSSPVAYNDKIIIGSTDGKIYSYNAKTYETSETPQQQKTSIKIPTETWLFLVIPLILLIVITASFLYLNKKRIT